MSDNRPHYARILLAGTALAALAACDQTFDYDLRGFGNGLSTTQAAQQATADRPLPDDRGVISYPNYQVAIARQGDRIGDVATRVGLPADELSRYNGINPDTVLREGEVIALPTRVAEPSPATGAITTGPIQPASDVDITTLAGDAIDRSSPSASGNSTAASAEDIKRQTGKEPIRHKVERGETAYSISRLYNVSVKSLADWNGLGSDLNVREGQFLLIPVVTSPAPAPKETEPGQGSVAPIPPSSSKPLPEDEKPVDPEATKSADLSSDKSTSVAVLSMPVDGKIIRPYSKDEYDGIDIAAPPGTPVKAAADGKVAAITRNTDQVPILVIRHDDGLLTVYAGVDNLTVKTGDTVKRGQIVAQVRDTDPSFLHFQVRKGVDNSVDPVPLLN